MFLIDGDNTIKGNEDTPEKKQQEPNQNIVQTTLVSETVKGVQVSISNTVSDEQANKTLWEIEG